MRKFNFTLDNGTTLTVQPPTLRMYYKGLLKAKNDPELFSAIADICNRNDEGISVTEEFVIDNFTTDDFDKFTKQFPAWVNAVRESNPNS